MTIDSIERLTFRAQNICERLVRYWDKDGDDDWLETTVASARTLLKDLKKEEAMPISPEDIKPIVNLPTDLMSDAQLDKALNNILAEKTLRIVQRNLARILPDDMVRENIATLRQELLQEKNT